MSGFRDNATFALALINLELTLGLVRAANIFDVIVACIVGESIDP